MTTSTWRVLAFLLLLGLAVAGCGDDGAPEVEVPPPPEPEPPPEAATDPMGRKLALELDDETLEALLAMHRRVLAAGADAAGAMAIGEGTERDYRWYTRALQSWRVMEEAVTEGDRVAAGELETLDKRIAELEREIAAADEPLKSELQQTLKLQRHMRPALAKRIEKVRALATPEVKALVGRWLPHFDAAEADAEAAADK